MLLLAHAVALCSAAAAEVGAGGGGAGVASGEYMVRTRARVPGEPLSLKFLINGEEVAIEYEKDEIAIGEITFRVK